MKMQSIIRAIYPAQCVACDAATEMDFGLCGACWRETLFISGTICDTCGTPLPGEEADEALQCDDCMKIARPWDKGRAALVYKGIGRRLVLGLKHGDRTDLVHPAALWMQQVAAPLVKPETTLVPVPLHWTRLAKRRYNQAALLAKSLRGLLYRPTCLDALTRPRRTAALEGHSRIERFTVLADAIKPNLKRRAQIAGRSVLLIDDVMTSGATLAACSKAAFQLGAADVSILTLARVVKDA